MVGVTFGHFVPRYHRVLPNLARPWPGHCKGTRLDPLLQKPRGCIHPRPMHLVNFADCHGTVLAAYANESGPSPQRVLAPVRAYL